jgi:hypothetical protein
MNEKRDAFVQKLKAQLDEWNADINELETKADQNLSWRPASTPVLTPSLIFRHLINGSLSLISLIHT